MHFYTEINDKVEPKHFVPMAKDPTRTRPSRTTDAKKAAKSGEIWYPSVTGILNVLDKPGLNNWRVDQHLQTVFESETDYPSYEDFLSGIKRATQERLDTAPQAGTDIHKILENNLLVDVNERDQEITDIEHRIIDRVGEVLLENGVDISQSDLEKYFICTEHGYAGCADVANNGWVIDYKSKQEASKFKPGKMAYPEHTRQLAAYGEELCEPGYRAANIFICLETGEIDFHEHPQEDIEKGWLDFKDCLSIFHRNTYNPKGEN